jgi:hypothetical protein
MKEMLKLLPLLFLCFSMRFSQMLSAAVFSLPAGIHQEDSQKVRTPRIGIILPLSGNNDSKIKTENILEFYKGMVLANEICLAQDSGLEFHLFDHRNKAAVLKQLSVRGCFDNLDLLIGPVKQNLIPPMDSIASQRSIPMMNVLSQIPNSAKLRASFSQQPGPDEIARTCFTLASEKASGCMAGIIYGTEKRDSLLAIAYRDLCLKNNKEVVLFRKVGKNSAANLSKYLAESGLDSVSHLFVPNNEAMVKVQLLAAYGILKARFPVFISGSWLEGANAEPDDFAGLPFFFTGTDLPIADSQKFALWQSGFISRWGNPPGWIAWKGFDLVMMLSASWYGSGKNLFHFDSGKQPSRLFGSYEYLKGRPENQFVPVYRVEKTGIVPENN